MEAPYKNSLRNHLIKLAKSVELNKPIIPAGNIIKISGLCLEATGMKVPLGTTCQILVTPTHTIHAEVIGFAQQITFLMALHDTHGIKPGTAVIPLADTHIVRVGSGLLGRIIDATGNPIDNKGVIQTNTSYPLQAQPINPLARKRIVEPLDVGIRAINALLTIGKGQRIGIFAGSGVGKSVLLGMMTRFTQADVVVVGLIGERGREVKEFIEESLGEKGLAKAVVVAAPSDTSPVLRANGAALATTIAEYYRDQGLDVLLIVDSLTRYAHAQREIALAIGELPATKGFSSSVFAKLSQLVERSGNGVNPKGSITAFYTVLVEGDDPQDPIGDHARSILDGHIFLSRDLADAGHYPAIDIEKSISRVMPAIIDKKQLTTVHYFKKLYSTYLRNKDIINVGMYQHGADKLIDEALIKKDNMENFLRQSMAESALMTDVLQQLYQIFSS